MSTQPLENLLSLVTDIQSLSRWHMSECETIVKAKRLLKEQSTVDQQLEDARKHLDNAEYNSGRQRQVTPFCDYIDAAQLLAQKLRRLKSREEEYQKEAQSCISRLRETIANSSLSTFIVDLSKTSSHTNGAGPTTTTLHHTSGSQQHPNPNQCVRKRSLNDIGDIEEERDVPSDDEGEDIFTATESDGESDMTSDREDDIARNNRPSGPDAVFRVVERTKHFRQISNAGVAFHRIIRKPKDTTNWWILFCDKEECSHNGKFYHDSTTAVIRAAGNHVARQHDTTRERSIVFGLLGYKVAGCTQEDVDRSNRMFDAMARRRCREKKRRSGPMTKRRKTRGESTAEEDFNPRESPEPGPSDRQLRHSSTFEGVVDPVPGDIYLGFYRGQRLGVVIFPYCNKQPLIDWNSLREGHRELLNDRDCPIPPCYKIANGLQQWQAGYADGESQVRDRVFGAAIVSHRDRELWPYCWISARSLEPIDPHIRADARLPLVSHNKALRAELERRKDLNATAARRHRAVSTAPYATMRVSEVRESPTTTSRVDRQGEVQHGQANERAQPSASPTRRLVSIRMPAVHINELAANDSRQALQDPRLSGQIPTPPDNNTREQCNYPTAELKTQQASFAIRSADQALSSVEDET